VKKSSASTCAAAASRLPFNHSIAQSVAFHQATSMLSAVATGVSSACYTSVKVRNRQIQKCAQKANQPLMPLIGIRLFNEPTITEADYIELVDFTGRQWHAGKMGKIDAKEPNGRTNLGFKSLLYQKFSERFFLRIDDGVCVGIPTD
jgi:hypothetical protein